MVGGTYGACAFVDPYVLQTGGPAGAEFGNNPLTFIFTSRLFIGLLVVCFHLKYL